MKYIKKFEMFDNYEILCENNDFVRVGDLVKLMMHDNEIDCYIKWILKLGEKRKKQKGYNIYYDVMIETILGVQKIQIDDCKFEEIYFVRKLTPEEIENSELGLKIIANRYNL